MLGLALRRLGDRGRAEDATQEAFVAIWRRRDVRLRAGAGPRGSTPWLATRSPTAFDGRPTPAPSSRTSPGGEPDPSDEAEASWQAWRVHRALEVLPEHERPVIELAYWRGLSQSEIADALGIPLGTVKTRTRSALARLADAGRELDDDARPGLRRARRHRCSTRPSGQRLLRVHELLVDAGPPPDLSRGLRLPSGRPAGPATRACSLALAAAFGRGRFALGLARRRGDGPSTDRS